MYDLFLVMKTHDNPTNDEILIASGKKDLDELQRAEYSKVIEAQAAGIKEAFAKQQVKAVVCPHFLPDKLIFTFFFYNQEPWNQANFEQLLIEWMVACDQPFEEVEKPEFIAAMSYGRSSSKFTLPKRDGVRRRVMKLGDVTVQEIKDMFAVIHLMLSCNEGSYIFLAGFGGQNQSFSRCLDVKQLLRISRHYSSFYLEHGAMR
jgi:hypothetical protein